MALTTAGLVMLIFLNSNTGLAFILVSLMVLGMGFGLLLFTEYQRDNVLGGKKILRGGIGHARHNEADRTDIQPGDDLAAFRPLHGRVQITPQYYPLFLKSMKTAFTISAVLCFAGIFASVARGKTHG